MAVIDRLTGIVSRRFLSLAFAAAALALGACSDPSYSPAPNPMRLSPVAAGGGSAFAVRQDAVAARGAQAATPARIAVTHSFTLRMPVGDIEAVQRRHLDECAKLGCTVLTTRLDRSTEGRVYAQSSIRISPDGFAAFAKALESAPATVVSHSETSEDKTVALLDVEKRVEVKTALRDRLEAMLKDPNTKSAADLLAIEKEFAQVQGDIESSIAQRDYLRTLTDTVRVDISYEGTEAQAGGIDLAPIKRAAGEFVQTMVTSLAAVMTFLAVTLPWVPLVLLLVWVARRIFRRWRARRA
jgi:hypothetical protein